MSKDKRQDTTRPAHASQRATELDEAQLEQARGGASDYLLQIDGIKGETGDRIGRSAAIAERSITQK